MADFIMCQKASCGFLALGMSEKLDKNTWASRKLQIFFGENNMIISLSNQWVRASLSQFLTLKKFVYDCG